MTKAPLGGEKSEVNKIKWRNEVKGKTNKYITCKFREEKTDNSKYIRTKGKGLKRE